MILQHRKPRLKRTFRNPLAEKLKAKQAATILSSPLKNALNKR
jgi:hypothetical protein